MNIKVHVAGYMLQLPVILYLEAWNLQQATCKTY